ncbi:MAG: FKBP-type peptidyl-prolyl cis-trans isomerase, partial [Acidobacteria bacterium]|nr:FKBP-type peptidyl-prolyl cis-trans isomerase [Acidobacteriota bacterium]
MLKRAHRSVSVLAVLTAVAVVPVAANDDIPAPSDVAAAPQSAEVTASGLASVVLREGSGSRHPQADSWVRVHYSGWTTDGKMFDSSIPRGASITLPLDRVIDGWTEGLQLMVEGEKRRLWIPAELAYAGREGRPQGMLVFDIELVDLVDQPVPPADLTAPPPNAEIHKKGLASKVLQPGHGDR